MNRAEAIRFIKFGIVGAIGAMVDFGILNLGIQVFGLEKWLANTFSFAAAVLSNFTWNRLWTFPESRAQPLFKQLFQFLLVNMVGYVINQLIFLSLDRWVFDGWGAWGYNLSKAIAIGVVLFWNFGINRIWTYREIR
ncbi:MAG: GtrA family protein [Chloroflexi bacterium]|jgi:putative flippase GtrA|nr:GtrA family protein [Chloroflexota bacterium]